MAEAKRRRASMPHVPHEVVREILLRLPTSSLLRFNRVCKAWRATISEEVFRRDLRLHRPDQQPCCLLIAPQTILLNHNPKTKQRNSHVVATTGLYRWRWQGATDGPATLMHPMDSLPAEAAHPFAHCDGLLLVPTDSTVRLLNPATRRILTMPVSGVTGAGGHDQAFGLGRDPRTNAFKVARFWQPNSSSPFTDTPRVEVFTIGTDQQWRELAQPPPHLIMLGHTATFFRGSLLWIIHPRDPALVSGFLRLKLCDETFAVVPRPPCVLWFHDEVSMSELRGELCVTCPSRDDNMLDMWMCDDVDGAGMPRWEIRYTICWDWAHASLRPVAILGDGVLICQFSGNWLCRCNLRTHKRVKVKGIFRLNDLEYRNLEEGTLLDYACKIKFSFDVIPYVPTLTLV